MLEQMELTVAPTVLSAVVLERCNNLFAFLMLTAVSGVQLIPPLPACR